MEGAKSFSIDALLAKDPTPTRRTSSPVSPALSSPNPQSPDSHKSNSFSPQSTDMGRPGSPAMSTPRSSPTTMHFSPASVHGGIIPRPGLLNVQHPNLGAAALAHGMFPAGHPGVYPYNGGIPHGGGGHPHPAMASLPMMNSAFHMPPDQALKAAQMHGMPLEWLARTGMFLPRPMDYAGMYILFIF